MAATQSLKGAYRKHSSGIEYRYEVDWQEQGPGGNWESKIFFADGSLVDTPGGIFLSTHGLSHATYVRVLIEENIKNRVD